MQKNLQILKFIEKEIEDILVFTSQQFTGIYNQMDLFAGEKLHIDVEIPIDLILNADINYFVELSVSEEIKEYGF